MTNKHVIDDSIVGTIKIPIMEPYKGKNFYEITIDNFEEEFIFHHDDDVDLCIIPIAPFVNVETLLRENVTFDISGLHDGMLPSDEDIQGYGAIEQIIMIGYPDGLMDEFNMKPIVRSGITATSLRDNYEDRREFLIDIACFGGSSGSPIFIYKEGAFLGKSGAVQIGTYLAFVGILYAGFDTGIEGEIKEVFVKRKKVSEIFIPLNIGVAIKSDLMLDFHSLIDDYLSSK